MELPALPLLLHEGKGCGLQQPSRGVLLAMQASIDTAMSEAARREAAAAQTASAAGRVSKLPFHIVSVLLLSTSPACSANLPLLQGCLCFHCV